MSPKASVALMVTMALGAAVAIAIAVNLGHPILAQEGQAAVSADGTKDGTPLGRTPTAIVDGQYPASFFPNTELLGPDEMRITALGTGMPKQ